MNKKIIAILAAILVVIILIGGGYYAWQKIYNNTNAEYKSIDPVSMLEFDIKFDNLTDYQKDVAFERFTNAKNVIMQNIEQGEGPESNQNFQPWLEVAVAQKSIGDFDRAEAIWVWFTGVHDHNSISPANLGDLYKSFKVDNEKSEKYYKIAIDRDKNDWQIFKGLYELYRYNFEDSEKAIAVLEEGYGYHPDEINYVNELAKYYMVLNDRQSAEEVIEEYISRHPEATSLKNKLQ